MELARARERLGLGVDEIAAALRIRAAYLVALEQGRVDHVPGGSAYALGFLRSYARALGLDPEAMTARLKTEAAVLSRRTELAFPAPLADRRLPAGAAALLASVLAIGVYAGWYRLSADGDPPGDGAAAVPAHLLPLVAPTGRSEVAVAPLAQPRPATTPEAPEPVSALAAETPTLAISPGSAAAATPVPVAAAPAAPDAGAPHLLVRAIADAWLQIRDGGGAVLFSRVLRAGESWPVPEQPSLVLTTGNAGGTVLVVDGEATAPLGAPGAVRRDVRLDSEALNSGRLAGGAASR